MTNILVEHISKRTIDMYNMYKVCRTLATPFMLESFQNPVSMVLFDHSSVHDLHMSDVVPHAVAVS